MKRIPELKNKILKLKESGLQCKEIMLELNISKAQYYYNTNEKYKLSHQKSAEKLKNTNPYWPVIRKLYLFKSSAPYTEQYTYLDVIKKYGNNPRCYLTNRQIDYLIPSSFQFDHILPVSKGGTSDLFNLGLVCPQANLTKSGLYLNDFYLLCEEALQHRKDTEEF